MSPFVLSREHSGGRLFGQQCRAGLSEIESFADDRALADFLKKAETTSAHVAARAFAVSFVAAQLEPQHPGQIAVATFTGDIAARLCKSLIAPKKRRNP